MEDRKEAKGEIMTLIVPVSDPRWKEPVLTGFMTKCGSQWKTWRKRFFVLNSDGKLYYFKNEKTNKPKNEFPIRVSEMKFSKSNKKRYCIKIERYPQPFFFFADNEQILRLWIENLILVGGLYCEFEISNGTTTPFSKSMFRNDVEVITRVDVRTWNPSQVQLWLNFHRLDYERRFSVYSKEFSQICGKDFEHSDLEETLRILKNLEDRKKIEKEVIYLLVRRNLDYDAYVVREKILEMTKSSGNFEHNTNWNFLSRCLSDPEYMMATYLSPNIEYFDLDKYIFGNPKNLKSPPIMDGNDEKAKKDETLHGNESSQVWSSEKFKIPLKLVLMGRTKDNNDRHNRRRSSNRKHKLLRPLLCYFSDPETEISQDELLVFVVIGRWLLGFNESGLIIPKTIHSEMATYFGDRDKHYVFLKNKFSFRDVCFRISRTICEWNVTRIFHTEVLGASQGHRCSSSDFAFSILQSLDVPVNDKKDPYLRFLMSENDNLGSFLKMQFCPTSEFREKFQLRCGEEDVGKFFRFRTHVELDEFLRKCSRIDELALRVDFKSETRILYEFDRVFWFLHLKDPENVNFKPSDCIFQHPLRNQPFVDHGYSHWKGDVYNS